VSTNPDTVAVITDIHGNLPALQAALARIEELGIESVFCGGDLVGYGLHPNEVCAVIAERDIPTIYGNYDYAAILRIAAARMSRSTTASWVSARWTGRSRTQAKRPRTSCAACRSTCTSLSATRTFTLFTARRGR
jgi:hypothetical protein